MAGIASVTHTLVNGHIVPLFSVFHPNAPFNAAETYWLLVKFSGFVQFETKEAFWQLHSLEILERFDENNVYLCRYLPINLWPVISHSDVTHIALFPIAAVPVLGLVIAPPEHAATQASDTTEPFETDQSTCAERGITDELSLVVALHPRPSESLEEILCRVETEFGAQHLDSAIDKVANLLRIKLDRSRILQVAAIDDVRSISEIQPIGPYTTATREALGINDMTASFPWDGSGETVYVADTGFDIGSITDVHPAFEGRVLHAGKTENARYAGDVSGHGTHVAGSVLGNLTQSPLIDVMNMKGTAPNASLVSLAIDFQAMPPLTSLFSPRVGNLPAPVIHTNSWGSVIRAWQLPYAAWDAYLVDRAMSNDAKLCILFSAGNFGSLITQTGRQQQVSSYAAAKNNIVVGASKNIRPVNLYGQHSPLPFGNCPNAGEIASFSSRGPTLENRQGIDIVAPGEGILSARSRSILPQKLERCRKQYGWPILDSLLWLSGTSMSTPAIAGCVACLRQAYKATYNRDPSGAMLKALLIHGAIDLQGVEYFNETLIGGKLKRERRTMTAAPNAFQGYGLAHMPASIKPLANPPTNRAGTEEGSAGHGITLVNVLMIPPGLQKLVVTLAYTDQPGAALQNIIGLRLWTEEMGNFFPLPLTDPLNHNPPISFAPNNVAKVVLTNPLPAYYRIYLDIRTMQPSAPYSVVWSAF